MGGVGGSSEGGPTGSVRGETGRVDPPVRVIVLYSVVLVVRFVSDSSRLVHRTTSLARVRASRTTRSASASVARSASSKNRSTRRRHALARLGVSEGKFSKSPSSKCAARRAAARHTRSGRPAKRATLTPQPRTRGGSRGCIKTSPSLPYDDSPPYSRGDSTRHAMCAKATFGSRARDRPRGDGSAC